MIQYQGEKNNFKSIFESLGGKKTVEKICAEVKQDANLDGLLDAIDRNDDDIWVWICFISLIFNKYEEN